MKEKLQEAINLGKCILCHLLREDEFKVLSKWVGNRQEEEFQKTLLNAGGFCNDHLWKFAQVCDPNGFVYLTRSLLQEFLTQLQRGDGQNNKNFLKKYKEDQYNLSNKNLCPACDYLSKHEKDHIKYLIDFLKDKSNMDIYQNSRDVCIPHFVKVYFILENDHMKNRFSDIQKKHTKLLLNELEGFIGKKDMQWERTKDENVSYNRAIFKLVGRRGTKW